MYKCTCRIYYIMYVASLEPKPEGFQASTCMYIVCMQYIRTDYDGDYSNWINLSGEKNPCAPTPLNMSTVYYASQWWSSNLECS